MPTTTRGFHVIRWIETHCIHTQGQWIGQPFRLMDWQKQILLDLFELEPDGRRRYRWALVGIPKKNGKTELAAALAAYFLIADGEPSPLVVCAAASEDQADLVFGAVRTMCELSPTLSAITERYEREILVPSIPGARLRRLSAVAGANDGMNCSAVFLDELHEFGEGKGRAVWNVLTNSTGARRQPMVFETTTAGFDPDTVCFEQYQHLRAIESGEIEDRRYFGRWVEAPAGADYKDPATWKAANPSYGVTVHEEFFEDQLSKKSENTFRRYFLNQWTESEETWIAPAEWDACVGDVTTDRDAGYIGVDIGQIHDTSAVVTVAFVDGVLHVIDVKIWEPQPGKPIAISEVEAYVFAQAEKLRIREIVYDPWRFTRSSEAILERGLQAVEIKYSQMGEASTTLYDLVREGKLVHAGDLQLRAHVLAAVGVETGSGYKIEKRKSGKKPVDGAVALAMATLRAVKDEGGGDMPFVEVY